MILIIAFVVALFGGDFDIAFLLMLHWILN